MKIIRTIKKLFKFKRYFSINNFKKTIINSMNKRKNNIKNYFNYSYIDLAATFFASVAAFLIISNDERKHLTVKRYNIQTNKKINKHTRFVFLSDLHDNEFGTDNEILLNKIDSINPDAILIGGDMMVVKKRANINKTLSLCEKLSKKYPIYYGNGNHENRMSNDSVKYNNLYEQFHNKLTEMGIVHLEDNSAIFGEDICITGIDIDNEYYRNLINKKMKPDYIEKKAGMADRDKYQILLAHSPLFFDAYSEWGADLSLSGHFHGGTIRLSNSLGLMTPQYQFFSRKVAGIIKKDNAAMIISPGLGTHSINIRINNKPEIIVIDL